MFVKHIIKTLHVSVTIVWPSSGGRLSCLVLLLPFLLICVVKLFVWYMAVRCLCVCVPYVLVCEMSGCELFTVYLVCGCMLSMCVRVWCTCLWDVWLWTVNSLFGMWLYVVYVCAYLMYLSVGCLVVNCSQFIWYVAVCCLCVCVPDVLVCGMFGCE